MRKHVLTLAVSAALTCAALPALAQDDRGGLETLRSGQLQSPRSQTSEATGQGGMMGGGMMGGGMPGRGGMMGRGMMDREGMRSGGMARGGMMGPGARGPDALTHSTMMRMMFALVDADGDGAISLQEFQAAHERIFRAMDSNKDGRLSLEEMQNFMHGSTSAAPAR